MTGLILYPISSAIACRLEGLERPRARDHLRHAFASYLAVSLFMLALWPRRATDGGALGFAVAALLAAAGVIGIVINAASLASRSLRNSNASATRSEIA